MADFVAWREGAAHVWVSGNGLPPSRAQRIGLDEVYHTRLRYALRHWRDRFGLERDDIEEVGLPVLLAETETLGGQSGVIAATSDDPLDWLLLYSTADFGFAANLHHALQPMRQFAAENLIVASCLSLPDAFSHGGAVAHRVGGVIDDTHLIYDRLAFPLFLNGKPRYLVTVSDYLQAVPATTSANRALVSAMNGAAIGQSA